MRNKALFIVVCLWPLMSLLHAQANSSLYFDNEYDYVTVSNSDGAFSSISAFSLQTWFKLDRTDRTNPLIANWQSGWYFWVAENTPRSMQCVFPSNIGGHAGVQTGELLVVKI